MGLGGLLKGTLVMSCDLQPFNHKAGSLTPSPYQPQSMATPHLLVQCRPEMMFVEFNSLTLTLMVISLQARRLQRFR